MSGIQAANTAAADENVEAMKKQILRIAERVDEQRKEVNLAYSDRALVLGLLAKLYPSSLEDYITDDEDPNYREVLIIDLPTGQTSWIMHANDIPMLSHVKRAQGRRWDGHTSERRRLRVMAVDTKLAEDQTAALQLRIANDAMGVALKFVGLALIIAGIVCWIGGVK